MKKIFSSVFIIATIITPLFLLHKVQKVEADWYYSAAFSATSGKADQPPSKANFAVDNTCNDTCAKNKCIAALDTWTKDEFYQTHKSDYIVTGCTSDEVTPLTGKQPAAGDKYDPIYHLLAPIGNFTEIKTDDIGGYFSKIFLIAIGLCGALAVIMFVIGGIQYMGEESIFGKTKGKEQMTSAILGLLIALGSWALLNTINPDLLGGSGLLISSANIELEAEPLASNDSFAEGMQTTLCKEGIITVSGMPICKNLEDRLKAMLLKATGEGINLTGFGYRSKERQEELRAKYCGGTANIYVKSAKCKPPTAIPGNSMHQQGLAIDFYCDGSQIKSKSNKCFVWLQKNNVSDAVYGFKNLDSEPWHWSTTGQ